MSLQTLRNADLVQRRPKLGGVPIDAICARALELVGPGRWPARRQELLERLAVARLETACLVRRELAADLAPDRAREQPATHPDAPVDPPAVDRHAPLGEHALPREDVGVDGVHE